jgi:type IV secretory pathway VirB6-like protein
VPFLKKFFYLLVLIIILSNCDGRGCIEANDFGEWNTDSLIVGAKKELCSGPDGEGGIDSEVEKYMNLGYFVRIIAGVEEQFSDLRGKEILSYAIDGCKVKIKDTVTGNPYATILKWFDEEEDIRKERYNSNVVFSTECGDEIADRDRVLKEIYELGVASAILKCQKENRDDISYTFDRYEPTWKKIKDYSKVTGGIEIGNGQIVEIRAVGDVNLSAGANRAKNFDANTDGLQENNFFMKKKIQVNVAGLLKLEGVDINETVSNINMKSRTEFLRRGVVVFENLPLDGTLDEMGQQYASGADLQFDRTTIVCEDGVCRTDYSMSDPMRAKNNNYYALQNGFTKTFGGQVFSKDSLKFFTKLPFAIEKNTGNYSFEGVKNGHLISSNSITINDLKYPVKIAAKNFATGTCTLSIVSTAGSGTMSVVGDGKWRFLNGSEYIFNKYTTPEKSSYSISVTKGAGCGGDIGVFFIPQQMIKVANSGFVEFKNINSTTETILKYTLINPRILEKTIADINNNFYENQSASFNPIYTDVSIPSSSWSNPNAVYVRKGQIISFSEKSFFTFTGSDGAGWTISEKPSTENLIMLITKRPALLCKTAVMESVKNQNCSKAVYIDGQGVAQEYCKLDFQSCDTDKTSSTILLTDPTTNRCPTGCYLKRMSDDPGDAKLSGENWSDVFQKSGDTAFYQIYFADSDDKKANNMNICPYPLYAENGEIMRETFMKEGVATPITYALVTPTSCQACYNSKISAKQLPSENVNLVQCYDLEEYIGSMVNFNANNDYSFEAGAGAINKTPDEVVEYGRLSKNEYELGARKLPSLNNKKGNYASLESLVIDDNYKIEDANGTTYSKISYRGDFPVYGPTNIKFLLLKNNNFNFLNTTPAEQYRYSFSYSDTATYKNGQQLAVVVANKDWDRMNLAEIKDWLVKYDITYDCVDNCTEGQISKDAKLSSMNYGKLVKDYTTTFNFNYAGSLINEQQAVNKYLFTAKGYDIATNVKDYSLFFKIIDRRYIERGGCTKAFKEPMVDSEKEYSCDDGETWNNTWAQCPKKKKRVFCSPEYSQCTIQTEINRPTTTVSKLLNKISISKKTYTRTRNQGENCADYVSGDITYTPRSQQNSPTSCELVEKFCPEGIIGKECAQTGQNDEDNFFYVSKTCPNYSSDDYECASPTKQNTSDYRNIDLWLYYKKECVGLSAGEYCAIKDEDESKFIKYSSPGTNEQCTSGGGSDCSVTIDKILPIDGVCPVNQKKDGVIPYFMIQEGEIAIRSKANYTTMALKETELVDKTTTMADKFTITKEKAGGTTCPAETTEDGKIFVCDVEQTDELNWKYVEKDCPSGDIIVNNVLYICQTTGHTDTQWSVIEKTCTTDKSITHTVNGLTTTKLYECAGADHTLTKWNYVEKNCDSNVENPRIINNFNYACYISGHSATHWKYIRINCPELDGYQCKPVQNNQDNWMYIKNCDAKWYSKLVDDSGDVNPIERYSSTACEDMHANNSGKYLVSLRAPRTFKDSGNDILNINMVSYLGASATGMIIKYLITPVLETFDGKTMGLQKTSSSSSSRPAFIQCEAGQTCAKYKGNGWKIGCARGDNLCYDIAVSNEGTPVFLVCDDNKEEVTNDCIIRDINNNEFKTVCKAGDSNCYKICSSDMVTNLCGVYTSQVNVKNSDLAMDVNFGQKCKPGDSGCYKTCEGLSDELLKSQCIKVNNNGGFVKRFYLKVITSYYYNAIIRIGFAISISLYGLWSLMGFAKLTHKELILRMTKMGFIYLMIGSTGWTYYETFFVKFFKDGVDYITFGMTAAFSQTAEIISAFDRGDFSDASVLFTGTDKNLALMFSAEVSYKIFGLLFVSFFGWAYVIILYGAIVSYVFAMGDVLVSYIIAHLLVSILLGFGPIFIVLLAFEKTKNMFNKWVNSLISFGMEQILLLTTMHFFNVFMYSALKFTLSYKVCWKPIWTLNLPLAGRLNILQFWKASTAETASAAASDIPGLFRILIIYIIAELINNFLSTVSGWGSTYGGSDISIHGLGGIGGGFTKMVQSAQTATTDAFFGKDNANGIFGGAVEKLGKRAIGYKTDKEEETEKKSNKTIRDGLNTANKKAEEARNQYLADKLKKGEKIDAEALEGAASAQREAFKVSLTSNKDAMNAYKNISGLEGDEAIEQLKGMKGSDFQGRSTMGVGVGAIKSIHRGWGRKVSAEERADRTETGGVSLSSMKRIATIADKQDKVKKSNVLLTRMGQKVGRVKQAIGINGYKSAYVGVLSEGMKDAATEHKAIEKEMDNTRIEYNRWEKNENQRRHLENRNVKAQLELKAAIEEKAKKNVFKDITSEEIDNLLEPKNKKALEERLLAAGAGESGRFTSQETINKRIAEMINDPEKARKRILSLQSAAKQDNGKSLESAKWNARKAEETLSNYNRINKPNENLNTVFEGKTEKQREYEARMAFLQEKGYIGIKNKLEYMGDALPSFDLQDNRESQSVNEFIKKNGLEKEWIEVGEKVKKETKENLKKIVKAKRKEDKDADKLKAQGKKPPKDGEKKADDKADNKADGEVEDGGDKSDVGEQPPKFTPVKKGQGVEKKEEEKKQAATGKKKAEPAGGNDGGGGGDGGSSSGSSNNEAEGGDDEAQQSAVTEVTDEAAALAELPTEEAPIMVEGEVAATEEGGGEGMAAAAPPPPAEDGGGTAPPAE